MLTPFVTARLVGTVEEAKLVESENWHFNAATGEYRDVFKADVTGTAKVWTERQDAASIADILILIEALVADQPKKERAVPSAGNRIIDLLRGPAMITEGRMS